MPYQLPLPQFLNFRQYLSLYLSINLSIYINLYVNLSINTLIPQTEESCSFNYGVYPSNSLTRTHDLKLISVPCHNCHNSKVLRFYQLFPDRCLAGFPVARTCPVAPFQPCQRPWSMHTTAPEWTQWTRARPY